MNDTTLNSIEWKWGGHFGRIHPLAFVDRKWDMEYFGDFMYPCVCDPSVDHFTIDTDNKYKRLIKAWG